MVRSNVEKPRIAPFAGIARDRAKMLDWFDEHVE
jgi:hypothetical protein